MNGRKSLFMLIALVSLFTIIIFINPQITFAQKAAKKLTVERIFDYDKPSLSGSLPSNIQWLPDSKSFIYEEKNNETKEWDLWQFDTTTGKADILLTSETLQKAFESIVTNKKEMKISPRDYTLSPDGKTLLFTFFGDLYCFNMEKKTLRRLTASKAEEQNPEFSPNSRYIGYTRDNNLFVLDLSTDLETQLTADGCEHILNGYLTWVYYEELYFRGYKGFWWSPDSKYITFYRFDESKVFKMPMVDHIPIEAKVIPVVYPKAGMVNPLAKMGIVSIDEGKIAWIDIPAEEEIYIARAIWLPDGKQLSLQILNRDQNKLRFLLADPETGKTKQVFSEEQETWVTQTDDIHFMKNKQELIWTSDRDGWNHFYLYDLKGNLISQLTKGKWQVSSLLHVDEENDLLYFTADEKSSLEKHIYRIKLDGTGLEQLSKADGWHSIRMAPSGKLFLDSYSTVMRPPMMELFRLDGTKLYTIEENIVEELADYPMSKPEFLTFKTDDGLKLPAMMIKPQKFNKGKKYPVIVSIYGGPESQEVANRWGGSTDLWYQLLAEKGFIIFVMDNRCSAHFGKEGASKMYRNFGHWEVEDQKSAVTYLRTLPYVDASRIGIWGWSYGGYNTCMTMLKAADYFQVGVAVAPVTDFRDYDSIYTERYMDMPQDNPEGYKNGSALNFADQLKGKLLIIHGTMDDNVHFQNSVQLANELIKHQKQFDFMLYPRRAHGIYRDKGHLHVFTLITNYFIRYLIK
jgi:dipeptidyl-peptidase-4